MKLLGSIDGVFGGNLFGWVADSDNREASFRVRIFINGTDIGVVEANQLREEMRKSGFGPGHYGFVVPLPDWVGDAHQITLAVGEVSTGWPLVGSHVTFIRLFHGRYARELVHADKDTVIFLTSPISGTGSAIRILDAASRGHYRFSRYTDEFYHAGALEQLRKDVPPTKGHVLAHNVPSHLNTNLDFARYRWIVNMRDPRDLLCNQYYWIFSHPRPDLSEDELREFREKIRSNGIDHYALQSPMLEQYAHLIDIVSQIPAERVTWATYASLCLDFDTYVKTLTGFLDVELRADQVQTIEKERSTHLQDNPNWIGNQWPGADATPGRYLNELEPRTILALNERFAEVLAYLKRVDNPAIAHTYDVQTTLAEVQAAKVARFGPVPEAQIKPPRKSRLAMV